MEAQNYTLQPIMDTIDSAAKLYEWAQESHDIAIELARKVNSEKERLLRERIKTIAGEEIDISTEIKRLFPRVKGIKELNGSESYYWNDGSTDGKLLIRFYPINESLDYTDPLGIKCTFGFKYK